MTRKQAVARFSGCNKATALPVAKDLRLKAQIQLEKEAIGTIEYYQEINQALQIQIAYLQALQAYNQAIIDLGYILGQSL